MPKEGMDRTKGRYKCKTVLIVIPTDIRGSGGSVVRPMKIYEVIGSRWHARLFGCRFHRPDFPSWKSLLLASYWLMSLVLALLRTKFDCIYLYSHRYGFVIAYLLRKLGIRNYKIVYEGILTIYKIRHVASSFALSISLESFAIRHADLVVANSTEGLTFYKQSNRNVQLIRNFVLPKPIRNSRDSIRERYNLGLPSVVVGLIGPFDNPYNRDHLRFLRSAIHRFDPRIKFLVIGNVPLTDRLIHPNIVYAGFVEDYFSHLAALDCIVIPRTVPTDGAMNRVVEAMSLGVPIFTTPVGFATIEQATPDRDIFVSDLGNMPEKMNEVVFDRTRLAEARQQALVTFQQYYADESGKLLEALGSLVHI